MRHVISTGTLEFGEFKKLLHTCDTRLHERDALRLFQKVKECSMQS